MIRTRSLFFLFVLLPLSLRAEVRFPSLFTDNMVLQREGEVPVWGWADAGAQVTVTPSWDGKTYKVKADRKGAWRVKIQTPAAGGPYDLVVSDGTPATLHNVLIGEVWVCSGQSNMEMPLRGYPNQPILGANETILHSKNDQLRLYTVPRSSWTEPQENSKPSAWEVAGPAAVADFSATAYYFGSLLQEILDVPVGLIHTSWGGSTAEAWMTPLSLKPFPDVSIPGKDDSIKVRNRTPTTLYNGMIHPIIGYGMRGVIWYQGESNADRAKQYETLFPALVQEWRTRWGQGEFPFYYAQIAPYNYDQPWADDPANSAYLRDAQRKVEAVIPNSGMAVLMDIGEEDIIHPANKQVGGHRLAYWALAKTYGIEGIGYASPTYEAMEVKGSTVEVKFSNPSNGLTTYGKPLTQFEIAGEDQIFYPAQAILQRGSIAVSSPMVQNPVAVRYAFKDFIVGELFGTDGLPVSSFRTDDWEEK
ncbi:sialate O-acetylesterase [Catalinimonas alkaloidigena]|nr:sialate O-acetylesterase [Catalinimonas alkaloidigena]